MAEAVRLCRFCGGAQALVGVRVGVSVVDAGAHVSKGGGAANTEGAEMGGDSGDGLTLRSALAEEEEEAASNENTEAVGLGLGLLLVGLEVVLVGGVWVAPAGLPKWVGRLETVSELSVGRKPPPGATSLLREEDGSVARPKPAISRYA